MFLKKKCFLAFMSLVNQLILAQTIFLNILKTFGYILSLVTIPRGNMLIFYEKKNSHEIKPYKLLTLNFFSQHWHVHLKHAPDRPIKYFLSELQLTGLILNTQMHTVEI